MGELHNDHSAAILVGRLIRSYRDDARSEGRRLSQEGLLNLMVERGEEYAADLDRSNVSRWESGARLAPREFLVALGRTLNLPKPEVDRMLSLAGYETLGEEEGRAAMLAAAQSIESRVDHCPSSPPARAQPIDGIPTDQARCYQTAVDSHSESNRPVSGMSASSGVAARRLSV